MSFWFITHSSQRIDGAEDAVFFPSSGFPDLSRALSREHLREWIKQLREGSPPEAIDDETNFYWKLYTELHRDDFIIAVKDEHILRLGEVIGDYHFESTPVGGQHVWPVRWIATDIPYASFESLRVPSTLRKMKEIPGNDARIQFRTYFPSWQTKGYLFFRWISVVLLLAELVYFWPHK